MSVSTAKRFNADVSALMSIGLTGPDGCDGNVGNNGGQNWQRNLVDNDASHLGRRVRPDSFRKGSHSFRRQATALTSWPAIAVPPEGATKCSTFAAPSLVAAVLS